VTVRRRGAVERSPADGRVPIASLVAATQGATRDAALAPAVSGAATDADAPPNTAPARSPLLGEVARIEKAFGAALATRRAVDAAEAILALDRTIVEWSNDTLQTDGPDHARAVLHSLIHRLGETASAGRRDPKDLLAPLVDRLVAQRAERTCQLADRLHDRLVAAGIELHDTPDGTTWTLRE
jgi:cysteinyl-tRNA synthetase